MMLIAILINGKTERKISVANITKGGLSNDRLNQYSVFVNGKNTKIIVDHWRDDGINELCYRVFKALRKVNHEAK